MKQRLPFDGAPYLVHQKGKPLIRLLTRQETGETRFKCKVVAKKEDIIEFFEKWKDHIHFEEAYAKVCEWLHKQVNKPKVINDQVLGKRGRLPVSSGL